MPDDWGGNGIGTDPLYPAPTERRLDESCPADVRAPAGFYLINSVLDTWERLRRGGKGAISVVSAEPA